MTSKSLLLILLLFIIPIAAATTAVGGSYEVLFADGHWALENISGKNYTVSLSVGPSKNVDGGVYELRTIPPFVTLTAETIVEVTSSDDGGSGGSGGGQTIYNYCDRLGGTIITLDNGQVRCELPENTNTTITSVVNGGLSGLSTIGEKIWPKYPVFGWMILVAVVGLLLNILAADREKRTMKALVKGKKKAKDELEDEDDE